jgi:3-(methylthio)propanoyl-CoA dehydrogenase
MMNYTAPIKDMVFVLDKLANIDATAELSGFEEANLDTAQAVLTEAAKFSSGVIAPLNADGDRHPSEWRDGEVTTTPGFKEAFRQFSEGGWQGVMHPADFGGHGLSKLIATPCVEMLHSANLSFALCPMLTDGAIEALLTAGSDELKTRYLPKLIAAEWTGTMNLTEPQAGSDLAMVRSLAIPDGEDQYRVSGTKIFITYGEHDMAENIVHLVLARTPDAPEGVKGISLFLVPKFLVNDDGSLGERNDVHCVSIEDKLGVKASPTAVLQFGDNGGAIGYLVGEENRGLEYMFIMMNSARFAVGMQGVAVSEAAYQKAVVYAKERVQSRPVDGSSAAPVAIIHHPDVRRMLMTMRALTEGARALAYVAAMHADLAHNSPDDAIRSASTALYEYLVPVVKGWSTEMSIEVASLGLQVHGGMGFIEETGAAQFYRDARILTIYEGTTAIQANDLVGRKTLRDGGAVTRRLADALKQTLAELDSIKLDAPQCARRAIEAMRHNLKDARDSFVRVVDFVVATGLSDPNAVFAGGVAYLKLAGIVLCGWQMGRALIAAVIHHEVDHSFYDAKIATAHFYADFVLPQAFAFEMSIVGARNGEGLFAMTADQF